VVAPENFPRPGSTAKPLSDHIPLGGFVHFTNQLPLEFSISNKWRAVGRERVRMRYFPAGRIQILRLTVAKSTNCQQFPVLPGESRFDAMAGRCGAVTGGLFSSDP
jgi:hypothetical protein